MRFNIYLFFTFLAILCSDCNFIIAKAMFGTNIKLVSEGEFSFTVSIMVINDTNSVETNHECTGSIISKHSVLTAAHCLVDKESDKMKIIIGSVDLKHGKEYYPSTWITYNDWAKFHKVRFLEPENDIGIIQLLVDVPDDITPVRLLSISNKKLYGLDVVISGWGKTHTGEVSRFMETVTLTVLSYKECKRRYLEMEKVEIDFTRMYLCTVAEPSAVMGDGNSGGPVLYNGELVAVHKGTLLYLDEPYHPNKINIHLSIEHYREFILDITTNY